MIISFFVFCADVKVLIDQNGDGDFEDQGEAIISVKTTEEVIIPLIIDDYEVGSYRMRVMFFHGRLFSLCDGCMWGETEDVLIEVVKPQPCGLVLEQFNYPTQAVTDPLSGGQGWGGPWDIINEDGHKVLVLSQSLYNESQSGLYNKLGLLIDGESAVHLKRPLNLPLNGTDEFYFSIMLQRFLGMGHIDISIDDVQFGVNEVGQFYLADSTFEEMVEDEVYVIMLKLKIGEDGNADAFLWINPVSPNFDESEAHTAIVKIKDKFSQFTMDIASTDIFVPVGIYVDEIRMGCDDNFKNEKSGATKENKANYEVSIREEIAMNINIWPNPSLGTSPKVKIEKGFDLVYPSELFTMDGQLIWTGYMVNGVNTLAEGTLLNSGLYVLVLNTSQGQRQQKIVIY